MSFFLKALGFGFLIMAALVITCVIAFVWARHGFSKVGSLFAMGNGLDAIALTFAFAPGAIILLTGYWMGRRPRRARVATEE